MTLDEFIKEGVVRKSKTDINLIKSLMQFSEEDLKYLEQLEINEFSSRMIFTGYYDVLRKILEAIASTKGYKAYSHEFFTYLLKKMNEPIASLKFDRFRKIRNSIQYYAKNISPSQTKELVSEIKETINLLRKKYLNKKSLLDIKQC